jgi:hypothetical protein
MTMRSPRPATLLILDHLPMETVAEGEEKTHRHRPPDDAEGGEEGAQLLAPQIAGQLPEERTETRHTTHPPE